MKHYLNKFQNLTGYTNAVMGVGFKLPHVSLIDNTHEVKYAPIFNPKYLYSDLSTSRVLDSSKTVIGIEVIPASHEADGKARFVSVKNMSRSNPEAGSVETGNESTNSAAMIPWGNYNDDISGMTNYQDAGYQLKRGTASEGNPYGFLEELDSNNTDRLVTDFDNGLADNEYPFFDGAYFNLETGVSGDESKKILPYPFNADGTKNMLYWNNGNGVAVTDMNGAGNTKTLINRIDVDGWQTGELNTTVSDGSSTAANHPAAAACYRFNPASSNTAHQWYLPSAGELGYLWANIAKINAKIDALPSGQGVKLGILSDSSASVDSLGYWLWASSEQDASNAWYLHVGAGYLLCAYDKIYAEAYSRVRAFIAI